MDCLIAIGTSIVGKSVEYIVEPVGRQLGYCFYYKSNVDSLKTQIQDLKGAKERIEHSVDDARRNGEEIEGDVQNWLSKAEKLYSEAEKLLPRDADQGNTRCSSVSFSNLILRYQGSKKAMKIGKVISEILDAGKFNKVSYRPPLRSSITVKGYENFETRTPTLLGIMEALRDVGVSMIGVYGMGGVGKTMLAREAARQAQSENLFSQVVMITVSQTLDCRKAQEEVAENLGLKLDESTLSVRAKRLQDRLSKEKNILVILDDVWNKLELEDIGISFADDQKGCKILLTSRSIDVLCNDMEVDRSFRVGDLSEIEAMNLFNQIVGNLVDEPDFRTLGSQIVKECAGLPLAISTVANALKNKRISIWEDALQELRISNPTNIKDMHEKVYKSIKLSYNFLGSEEAKSLLLLCSLHEEDANIHIDDLLRHGVGLSLFEGITKLKDARNRVLNLVEILKTSSLLSDGNGVDFVKMHDVVRDVAISIAYQDKDMYFFKNVDELEEILKKNKLKDTTAISLCRDNENNLLPERITCPKLLFFMLRNKTDLETISDRTFEGTKELQVLDLNDLYLDPLLSSFSFLQNLRTLCLCDCTLGDIALIGELKNLEILNLSGSDLQVVPKQLGQLTRLRSLNLNYCVNLEVIKPNVISRLVQLEELQMEGSFTNWGDEESNGERSNASLIELKNLSHLTNLRLVIRNDQHMPEALFSESLERYRLFIGSSSVYDYGQNSRFMSLSCVRKSQLDQSGLRSLLKRTEELHISHLYGVNDVWELDKQGFSQLKILRFRSDNETRYIINTVEQAHPCIAFQSLEELTLERLNLEKICNCTKLQTGSFNKLKYVLVTECHMLKNLFSFSFARKLERIEARNCNTLEKIITHGSEEQTPDVDNELLEKIEFSSLRSLKLAFLPKLIQFFGSAEKMPNPESQFPLFSSKVSFPNLTSLEVVSCDSLKYLLSFDVAKGLEQLKHLLVRYCKIMEEVIVMKEPGEVEIVDEIKLLPRLEDLTLDHLPRLANVCNKSCIKFPSLKKMKINNCPKLLNAEKEVEGSNTQNFSSSTPFPYDNTKILALSTSFQNLKELFIEKGGSSKYLFASPVAASLVQLNRLEIYGCTEVEEIISMDKRVDKMFPQLNYLMLSNLPNLIRFCTGKFIELPLLTELQAWNCPKLINFISLSTSTKMSEDQEPKEDESEEISLFNDKVSLPNLKVLKLERLDSLKMMWRDKTRFDSSCKLEQVTVDSCKNLIKVLSSSALRRLQSLRGLVIKRCEMVEEVFEIQRSNVGENLDIITTQLSWLELRGLPKLKHVWSKDPQESFVTFQKLEKVIVSGCPSMENLFPASVAKGLLQLKLLKVKHCHKMKEIIAKEEGVLPVEMTPYNFVFPQLTTLILSKLPELECFYPGLHSIELSSIRVLKLRDWKKVTKIFSSELLTFQKKIGGEVHVVFPDLEEFMLFKSPWNEIQHDLCQVLGGDQVQCARMLSRLKVIKLGKQPKLMHLWRENSESNPNTIFQNLETLVVRRCGLLKKLVPSSISFRSLKDLMVSNCHGMVNLLTSSTAKSMVQLRRMSIFGCKRMIEVIANEGGDDPVMNQGEIVLSQLEDLVLFCLPNLTSFHSGKNVVRLPNLRRVIVHQCPEMQSFSDGEAITPELHRVIARTDEDELVLKSVTYFEKEEQSTEDLVRYGTPVLEVWEGDINTTIQKLWKTDSGDTLQQLFKEEETNIPSTSDMEAKI